MTSACSREMGNTVKKLTLLAVLALSAGLVACARQPAQPTEAAPAVAQAPAAPAFRVIARNPFDGKALILEAAKVEVAGNFLIVTTMEGARWVLPAPNAAAYPMAFLPAPTKAAAPAVPPAPPAPSPAPK